MAGLKGTDRKLSLTLSLPMLAGKTVDLYSESPDKQSLWPRSAVKRVKVGASGKVKVEMLPMGGTILRLAD